MSGSAERPFDIGLQTERTALAWQRTALSLVIAALIAVRLLTDHLGAASFIVGAVGVLPAVLVFAIGHDRYRINHTRLTNAGNVRIPLASAIPLLIYAVVALTLGVCGLALTLF